MSEHTIFKTFAHRGTKRIEVTYTNASKALHPFERYVRIIKYESNGDITTLSLTPEERRWISDILNEIQIDQEEEQKNASDRSTS